MRTILVTGSNGGLGQAIAINFLEESSDNFVWLGVNRQRERAEKLHDQYASRSECLSLDVTDPAAWKSAVSRITEMHGRIDVLVNNAGQHRDSLLATMPVNDWEEILDSNLNAVFHGCQSVLPAMIGQRHGRIVNVSSLSALLAPAGQTNYAAAKAGVVALTQSLAKEVARMGITVNAVCPGYVETEALAKLGPEEKKGLAMKIPMRRLGRPEEVAAAIRFLACSEAGYITGSILKIDGGIF